jgi:hypothetical protein
MVQRYLRAKRWKKYSHSSWLAFSAPDSDVGAATDVRGLTKRA